jgi:hypothetical protein
MNLTIETNFSLKTPGPIHLRSTLEELQIIAYMALQSTERCNMRRKSIGFVILSLERCAMTRIREKWLKRRRLGS